MAPTTEVEKIAMVAHEVNRAYCSAIGDNSQAPWDSAPEWQRTSAINGVQAHIERQLTPEQSHESWLEEKRRDGWRYGPVKDAVAKTHPCFVPYSELPIEQRIKDHLFGAVVGAMKGVQAPG
jgi:hypothetical protein